MSKELEKLLRLVENLENKAIQLSWDGVPDIPFSAMGWGKINTENPRAEINGELVRKYFRNISGNTFPEKLVSIQSTLSGDEGSGQASVQDALGRLVALKSIISNLTDFNDDSAGKNFEAIFAALMGGQQVTGADSKETADVVIGNRLYGIKLTTGKSSPNDFNILINSVLAKGKEITYLLGEKTGSKETLRLSFYEGIINVDNVMNLFTSRPLRATDEYYGSTLIREENEERLAELPQELQNLFSSREFAGQIPLPEKDAEGKYLDPMSLWDASFGAVIKQKRKHPAFILNAIHKQLLGKDIVGFRPLDSALYVAKNFYTSPKLTPEQQKVRQLFDSYVEFVKSLNKEGGSSTKSNIFDVNKFIKVDEYLKLPLEQKIEVLRNTVQSKNNENFYVTVTNSKVFKRVGKTIGISTKEFEGLYDSLRSSIDKRITEIFVQMKTLSDNINLYFADGMTDDTKAQSAIGATNTIAEKTQELRTGGIKK